MRSCWKRTELKSLDPIGIIASGLVPGFPLMLFFFPPLPTGLWTQSELQETEVESWWLYWLAKF